jgi:hypothetical protein
LLLHHKIAATSQDCCYITLIVIDKGSAVMFANLKTGVRCTLCSKILQNKSNFNRHHTSLHANEPQAFESVSYQEENGMMVTDFQWCDSPLANAAPLANADPAPGLLQRQTGYLSKGLKLFQDSKWAVIDLPPVALRDEAIQFIDDIDDFVLLASTVVRSQIHRSKSGQLKTQPFQALKDTSGAQYAQTAARFYLFARMHFDLPDEKLQNLVLLALTEECQASKLCCLEAFILCLPHNVAKMMNPDPLQHAAMHMRRVCRGAAMLHLRSSVGETIEAFCVKYLHPKRASAFGVLTTLYFEIKRCFVEDKRLLIHRTEPDDGFPAGSAILVA